MARLFGPDGAFAIDLGARTRHPRSLQIYEGRGGVLPRPWPAFEVHEISGTGRLHYPGLEILHAPVLHHQPYLDSLGFRIEGDGAVATYSSDIAITRAPGYFDSMRDLAVGADVLVHYLNAFDFDGPDMARSKPALMGQLAERLGVRMLVTTHHGPVMDRPGVRDATLAAIATTYSGQAIWGEDRLRFTIAAGLPPAVEQVPAIG
jgi:ribonuclease BN (tRNA processing enzyme)